MQTLKSPKILICKMSSIGDVVMATPVARAIKEAMPDAHIAWVIASKCLGVLDGNPWIDELLVWEKPSGNNNDILGEARLLPKKIRLFRDIRSHRFDIVIDLQGLFRSALCVLSSGAKIRIGFANAREGSRFAYNVICSSNNRGPQRYLDALQPLGIKSNNTQTYVPVSPDSREYANRLLEKLVSDSKKTIIAICPVSTWPHKTWPISHWAELARLIVDKGHILALGAPTDSPQIERISNDAGVPILNLAGQTTLQQAAAVIDMADIVVGLDSGLLHIALALGKQSIGIFGPTRWRYLTTFQNFTPIVADLPCIPCCKKKPKCYDFKCMSAVQPNVVATIVKAILLGEHSDESCRTISSGRDKTS